MNVITMDAETILNKLPEAVRRALQREAVKMERPLEEVIVSILVEKAERITGAAA